MWIYVQAAEKNEAKFFRWSGFCASRHCKLDMLPQASDISLKIDLELIDKKFSVRFSELIFEIERPDPIINSSLQPDLKKKVRRKIVDLPNKVIFIPDIECFSNQTYSDSDSSCGILSCKAIRF